MIRRLTIGLAVLACAVLPVRVAGEPNTCKGPEYRAFDFYLGAWVARHLDGKDFGTALVTKVLGDCAIRNDWHGGKYNGTFYSMWVKDEKRWQKSWFDDMGNTEIIAGRFVDGTITFEGTGRERQREQWRRLSQNKVRQTYWISEDGGKTWKTSFILEYFKLSK